MSGCQPARRLIAHSPYCSVEECSCGILHVTLGVLTIRLQREVVASIWETLGESLARLAPPPRGFGARSSAERPS